MPNFRISLQRGSCNRCQSLPRTPRFNPLPRCSLIGSGPFRLYERTGKVRHPSILPVYLLLTRNRVESKDRHVCSGSRSTGNVPVWYFQSHCCRSFPWRCTSYARRHLFALAHPWRAAQSYHVWLSPSKTVLAPLPNRLAYIHGFRSETRPLQIMSTPTCQDLLLHE